MLENSNLLPRKRFFNAKDIDLFVNYELSRETSILRRNSVDNVFSFSDKIAQERNACRKFCVYGMLQSKWFDCENLKIDVYIADSSTNANPQLNIKNPFWVYDRYSGISALTWSFNSRKLDSVNGALSRNIYYKHKASYFFPFELDLDSVNRTDGILTNKSIYLNIYDTEKLASLNQEIPFLFFDEDGVLFDFGEQSAQILDNGDILEVDTDYPYLYDRHWIRRELNPTGPSSVFFTKDTLFIQEGGLNADLLENKIIPIEVSLSTPSKFGIEEVKIEIVTDLDESGQKLTTINFPSDALINSNYVYWNFVGDSQVKYFYLKIIDDYFVEPLEKLTLRLVPIIGCLPDLNEPQIMTIYFQDNDIPSNVYFQTSTISFTEPRQDVIPATIPITLELDRRLLVDGQALTVYIDEQDTDCRSRFGFLIPNMQNNKYYSSVQYFFNKNDLTYTNDLLFIPEKQNDIQRKIVLKMSGLTSNLSQRSTTPNLGIAQLTITVDKNLDKTYTKLLIPFDKTEGYGVLRNVYNIPQSNYDTMGQGPSGGLTSTMAFPRYSIMGDVTPNVVIPNLPGGNIKQMVYENDFDLEIENLGDTVVFDGRAYFTNDKFTIQVRSGYTSNVSSGEFSYDGSNFVLKLPANELFFSSNSIPLLNSSFNFGTDFWGYVKSTYGMVIKNISYNAKSQSEIGTADFKKTNLLSNRISLRYPNLNQAQAYATGNYYLYAENMSFLAGKSTNEQVYNMYSMLTRISSQIQYDSNASAVTTYIASLNTFGTQYVGAITSYSGNTATYYPGTLFYKGATIIPNKYNNLFANTGNFPNLQEQTISKVFFTKEFLMPENELNVTGASGSTYGGLFPVSTTMLSGSLSSKTVYTRLYFRNLYYQSNFGTLSYINGVLQNPPSDAIVLNPNYSTNNIKPWFSANPTMRLNAIIEIVNQGTIPALIENRVLEVGQSLYISENPLPTGSTGPTFINIVKPLNPLNIDLPTNYRYVDKTQVGNSYINIDKFTQLKYKISFLNFKITSTNTFNYTINLRKETLKLIAGAPVTTAGLYLRTRYGSEVVTGVGLNSDICAFVPVYYLKIKQSPVNKKGVEVEGIIASTSSECPIVNSDFVESSELITTTPCQIMNLSFHYLNTNP